MEISWKQGRTITRNFIEAVDKEYRHVLPAKIWVMGQEYPVFYLSQKDLGRDVAGSCEYYEKCILINTDIYYAQNEEGHDGRALWSLLITLRHEVIHAYFAECGLLDEFEPAANEVLVDWLAIKFPAIVKTMNRGMFCELPIKKIEGEENGKG